MITPRLMMTDEERGRETKKEKRKEQENAVGLSRLYIPLLSEEGATFVHPSLLQPGGSIPAEVRYSTRYLTYLTIRRYLVGKVRMERSNGRRPEVEVWKLLHVNSGPHQTDFM